MTNIDLKIGIIGAVDWEKGLPMGGYSRVILSILKYLPGRQILLGIEIGGRNKSDCNSFIYNSSICKMFNTNHPSLIPLRIKAFFGYLKNRKKIENIGFDLLYVHTSESALPFLFGGKMPPVVFHQHGSANALKSSDYSWARVPIFVKIYEFLLKIVYKKSKAIIAIDELCYKKSVSYGTENKTYLISNPVDVQNFSINPVQRFNKRKEFGFSSNDQIIVFSGRLSRPKNVNVLIDAVSYGIKQKKTWKLLIAGDGPMKESLKNQVSILGLNSNVLFIGIRPYTEMPDIYRMADAIALPSSFEGIPMCLLEAMACGTPVVASKVGGIPEFVKHLSNGILLQKPEPLIIFEGLEKCFSHEWNNKSISASISNTKFNAKHVGLALTRVFEKITLTNTYL